MLLFVAAAVTETGAETGLEAGTEAATGSGVGAAAAGAAAGVAPDNAPMVPSCPPTRAMPSSATVISSKMPATGDGISVSTLSVETSSSASSAATESPMAFNQRVTVPSVTLSPSAGSTTGVIRPPLAGADGADSSVTGATAGATVFASVLTSVPASEATSSVPTTASAPAMTASAPAMPAAAEMTASAPPTRTTASSPAMISVSTPLTGEGISVSTLSVDTSSNGSSAVTVSPTAFSQRVTVPSVTLSPSWGIDTVVATVPLLLLLVVLRLSVKRGHGAACQPTP